ncbi:DnaJ-domain-containing protein [Lophiostoma macrostomum CBS 122681]|uniref:DnaJ-domain-containing protein n=1 Tax=Lophiostoma macrostomum CBS 122681 TaxID=1314788 RepID=A0A6A6SYP7_9PLEO|nr:DnaJ-domain-containing protein [Lophiostoma macrostomum CBS 122681]
MPLRPPTYLRPPRIANSHIPIHIHQSSLYARRPHNAIPPTRPPHSHSQQSSFHTTPHPLTDKTHYETLSLPPTATPAEIKRQFFSLSKTHHPDKNPNDPTASTRFVAISEAYHILSVPDKRAQYDAQLSQQHGSGRTRGWAGAAPQGSYSSHSFAGSRPATGLNKKRGTFRGPPPSFYKAGGYGRHGAKRAEYAQHQTTGSSSSSGFNSSASFGAGAGPGANTSEPGDTTEGGMGHGQGEQGFEVPHFDDQAHKRMHDHVNEYIMSRRRRERVSEETEDVRGNGTLVNFFVVTGVLAVIFVVSKVFERTMEKSREDRHRKRLDKS